MNGIARSNGVMGAIDGRRSKKVKEAKEVNDLAHQYP